MAQSDAPVAMGALGEQRAWDDPHELLVAEGDVMRVLDGIEAACEMAPTARELLRALDIPALGNLQRINKVLYRLKERGRLERVDQPGGLPRWHRTLPPARASGSGC